MIVTRSRLHAVRYRLAVDKYLAERGYPFKALVAFSGTVPDGGQAYTESNMNSFPEAQTAKTFERSEYRFLIVANKFQTGFDQPLLHTMLAPVVGRFHVLSPDEQHDFRSQLTDYVRLYAFLAQVLTFADADLEKLYVFARHLRRLLPADRAELPREVQQNIDMESYRIQQTGSGRIALERRPGVLDPVSTKSGYGVDRSELETLSRIIAELNERFGLNLGPEHKLTLGQMMEKLDDDASLDAAARMNTRENVRLTFDQKVEHVIQEIVDSNFDLYKRITDDQIGRASCRERV